MATRNTTRPSRPHDATEPITPLAGPYGHPFHPILVTVPIGAWICSLIFDIATRAQDTGSQALVEAAYWLIGIGVVGALLAALFGLLDLLTIPRGTKAFGVGLVHMALNVLIVAGFAANFLWRHGSYSETVKVGPGQLALSAGLIAALGVSGWLGGMLAYRYGVRVANEADQADGFVTDARHKAA